MRQLVKQRDILSYLQYIQWVILVLFLTGCQPAAPFITISHPPYGLLVPVEVDKYQVGQFEGDAPLARFIRERLNERLAQKMSTSPDTPEETEAERIVPTVYPERTFDISGSIHLSREMGLDESFGREDRVKMSVAIAPTQTKGPSRWIHFTYYTPEPELHSDQMRSVLSGWVDRIVDRLYRSDRKTRTQLARGKSRYDLQGRTWVEAGEKQKALSAFLQAIDDKPSDPACLYNAGLMCEALGDYRRALGFHQRARRLGKNEDNNLAYWRVESILRSGHVTE